MMKSTCLLKIPLMTVSFFLFLMDPLGAYGVKGVRVEPFEELTRIFIETDDTSFTYNDFTLDDPHRIVVDFTDAEHRIPKMFYRNLKIGGIETIRSSQFKSDLVRVTLVLAESKEYSLTKNGKNLIIDFTNSAGVFRTWDSSVSVPAADNPERSEELEKKTRPTPDDDLSKTDVAGEEIVPEPNVDAAKPEVEKEDHAPRAKASSGKTVKPEKKKSTGQTSTYSSSKKISIDFEDAGIKAVLRAFSDFSAQSIVAGRDVEGKITARITNVPWDQALGMILKAQGYGFEYRDGIYMVDRLENLRATEQLEGLQPTVFHLNYLIGSDMLATVQDMLSTRGTVSLDEKTNSLIVADVPSKINDIKSIIPILDRETKQVTIKSKLVFVNTLDLFQVGIDWKVGNLTNPRVDVHGQASTAGARLTDPFLELSLGTFRSGVSVSSILQALEESQMIDVQAQPQITTLDNLQAEVFVGERTPIRVIDVGAQTEAAATIQLIETGIRLTVTPHITNNDKIVMDLKAERSQAVTDPSEFGVKFQTQEGNTTLLVNDGQTAVIGGLTTLDSVESERAVPYISKLPLVGRLFRYKSTSTQKKDLLILVTPYIVPVEKES